MPFFAGGLYTADELGKFHLPARAFYAEQLAHGESFDWMPDVFSGYYLTGEGQVGTYHPLHHFLYRFLPLHAALGWEYLCSYPLMLAGMYFLLRRRLRRQDAAMVGSLAFTFSSFNLLHFVHPNAVAAVAHIPWLLAMIDIVMVDAQALESGPGPGLPGPVDRIADPAGLSAIRLVLALDRNGFHALPGHDAKVLAARRLRNHADLPRLHRLPAELVAARDHCQGDRPVGRRSPIAAHAGSPLPEHAQRRRRSPEGATLHPINLIQLVAPYMPVDRAFGGNAHELSLYVGAVPLMLALWVLVRRCDLGALKRLAQATAALAAAALLLALGSQGQFLRLPNSDAVGRLVPVLLPLYRLVPVRRGRAGGHRLRARRARSPGKAEDPSPFARFSTAKAGLPPCGGSSRSWARPS